MEQTEDIDMVAERDEDMDSLAQEVIDCLKPVIQNGQVREVSLTSANVKTLLKLISYILPNTSIGTCPKCGSNYRYTIINNKRYVCCSDTPPDCFPL